MTQIYRVITFRTMESIHGSHPLFGIVQDPQMRRMLVLSPLIDLRRVHQMCRRSSRTQSNGLMTLSTDGTPSTGTTAPPLPVRLHMRILLQHLVRHFKNGMKFLQTQHYLRMLPRHTTMSPDRAVLELATSCKPCLPLLSSQTL